MKIIKGTSAFTLIEIMIVVSVIGILASIGIPSFVKAAATAKQNTCISNMSRIRDAVDMWALDKNFSTGTTPLRSDIVPGYIAKWPKCISIEYNVPAVGANPTCPNGISSHTLDSGGTTGGGGSPPYASPSW